MDRQAFDVVGVAQIMALRLLVDVVKHNRCGDEVNNLAGRQLVKVRTAVLASIAVDLK